INIGLTSWSMPGYIVLTKQVSKPRVGTMLAISKQNKIIRCKGILANPALLQALTLLAGSATVDRFLSVRANRIAKHGKRVELHITALMLELCFSRAYQSYI